MTRRLFSITVLAMLAWAAAASALPIQGGSFAGPDIVGATSISLGGAPNAFADVNGDGRADYCRGQGTTAGFVLTCATARPAGGFGGPAVTGQINGVDFGYPSLPRAFADVNGDGRADYCRIVGNSPNVFLSCALARATRTFGNYDINSARPFDVGYGDRPRGFADVNGDGRADYCRFVGNAPGIFLSCALARTDGTFGSYDLNSLPGLNAGQSDRPFSFADANGDGRADFCRFVGNVPNVSISCAVSTGAGFVDNDVVAARTLDQGYSNLPRMFGDANGDGRVDYCRFVGNSPNIFLSCALAGPTKQFGNYDVNSPTSGFDPGSAVLPRGLIDANADGRADFCRFRSGATPSIACTPSRPPALAPGTPNFAGTIITPKIANVAGVRHVLAILFDPGRPDHPRRPPAEITQRLFGGNPSVRDWFRESSFGRLRLVRESVLGWYSASRPAAHYWSPTDDDPSDAWINGHEEKRAEAIVKADRDFNFSLYDTNGDHVLTPDELAIVIVFPQNGPDGFVRGVVSRQLPSPAPMVVDGVTLTAVVEWYAGSPADLGTPAHELSHLLVGTPDLYMNGLAWPFSAHSYSIMDQHWPAGHFDPFVKLKAGWLATAAVTGPGEFVLRDIETRREAIVLYDPARGPGEYFLLENRWRGSSYDAGRPPLSSGIPADGLAIWHIIEDPARLVFSNPPLGAPGEWGRRGIRLVRRNGGVPEDDTRALFSLAGQTISSATSPARLRWADGSATGFTIRMLGNAGPEIAIKIDR